MESTLAKDGKSLDGSFGVFHRSEADDINILVSNITAPSLARALRQRESMLQSAAELAEKENWKELSELLIPYTKSNVNRYKCDMIKLELMMIARCFTS